MKDENEIKSVVGWSKKNLLPEEEYEKYNKRLVELRNKAQKETKPEIN